MFGCKKKEIPYNKFYPNAYDARAKLANQSCKLLYNKFNGDLKNEILIEELKDMALGFHSFVREISEVVHTQIPLFEYWKLLMGNSTMSEEYIIENCEKYYK